MQQDCAALAGLLPSSSRTQGYGRFAASTLGCAVPRFQRFIALSLTRMPVRAAQSFCIALTGLNLIPIDNPGFQSPLARALPPRALLHRPFGTG
jgi:hypothetical protein